MAKASSIQTEKSKETKKTTKSVTGAPSQLNQSSRKGKRAWRKNVDIQDVERGMEEIRAEERIIGKSLQATKDDDLFQIDVQGDSQVRKTLRKFSTSQLTSAKILAQRSAVPAVLSRPSSTASKKRKSTLSYEEKSRLLRIGKRPRKGPFNSVIDPTEFGAGSAIMELTEAVKSSGTYDAWAPQPPQGDVKDGLETVQKKVIKAPAHSQMRDVIEVPAIAEPHQGTSYNPPVEAHQELLLQAHEIEEKRIRDAEKLAVVKEKMQKARVDEAEADFTTARGMKVDEAPEEDNSEDETGVEGVPDKRQPQRKTQAQRRKAARVLAVKRDLAERAARKRMLAVVSSAKTIRRDNSKLTSEREKVLAEKEVIALSKLKRQGLAGRKLGKHKVPEGPVDVQLGDDLSESLRALKPEGNLFRDRFLSLQQRALVEPRVPLVPKKRRTKDIEYEKHAWKRFE